MIAYNCLYGGSIVITLSTRGRYATRIVVNLARESGGKAKSARVIAQEEGLSVDYVEQLLIKLKAAGLITNRRGKHGGSVLAKSPEKIRMADLLNVIEGKLSLVPCITGSCPRKDDCPTQSLWRKANSALEDVFDSTTIKDLLNG